MVNPKVFAKKFFTEHILPDDKYDDIFNSAVTATLTMLNGSDSIPFIVTVYGKYMSGNKKGTEDFVVAQLAGFPPDGMNHLGKRQALESVGQSLAEKTDIFPYAFVMAADSWMAKYDKDAKLEDMDLPLENNKDAIECAVVTCLSLLGHYKSALILYGRDANNNMFATEENIEYMETDEEKGDVEDNLITALRKGWIMKLKEKDERDKQGKSGGGKKNGKARAN